MICWVLNLLKHTDNFLLHSTVSASFHLRPLFVPVFWTSSFSFFHLDSRLNTSLQWRWQWCNWCENSGVCTHTINIWNLNMLHDFMYLQPPPALCCSHLTVFSGLKRKTCFASSSFFSIFFLFALALLKCWFSLVNNGLEPNPRTTPTYLISRSKSLFCPENPLKIWAFTGSWS